jgi:hypothetical protein
MKYLWVLFTLIYCTTVYATFKDTDFQKVITEYGTWSVVINFMDVAKPQCQVKGVAATGDGKYVGPVTVWNEQWQAKDVPVAEVGLFKRINLPNSVDLKRDPGIHTLMTKKIGVKGARREGSNHHMALFNIGHGMIESMGDTDITIATLVDLHGKDHDLIILMEGFKEAWRHCNPQ